MGVAKQSSEEQEASSNYVPVSSADAEAGLNDIRTVARTLGRSPRRRLLIAGLVSAGLGVAATLALLAPQPPSAATGEDAGQRTERLYVLDLDHMKSGSKDGAEGNSSTETAMKPVAIAREDDYEGKDTIKPLAGDAKDAKTKHDSKKTKDAKTEKGKSEDHDQVRITTDGIKLVTAAIHGCCTWTGKCDGSQEYCNANEGRCKTCGGGWKNDTKPTDFGGWDGGWCASKGQMKAWELPQIPVYKSTGQSALQVKVLTYNLEWWEVYKKKGGEGGRQGQLIASSGPYDIMGFQECQDPWRVLADAGKMDYYFAYQGGGAKDSTAVCVLYAKDTWDALAHGEEPVAEDVAGKWTYFGKRLAVWYRLQHKQSKEIVFFVNHHGPLPLGSGGVCGGHATAYNILEVIQRNSKAGDAIIMVGDFNAQADSMTVSQLASQLMRAYSGWKFNGIDHVLSNLDTHHVTAHANIGGAGSDHDALTVTFELGPQGANALVG